MASSSFLLLLFLALLSFKPNHALELLNNVCLTTSSIGTVTSPTQYQTNLDSLLKLLSSRSTLASTGFAMGSAGDPAAQRAYGLINCWPNVSAEDCKTCAHAAAKAARSLCPGNQGALLWYDSCLLKYSDSDFLGTVDTQNQFSMSSPTRVSGDPSKFNARVTDFLTKLSSKAAADPKLFGMGKTKADPSTTVYGMAECTRDLSGEQCGQCLGVVVGGISGCCSGLKGGRVITGSCMVRYEMYAF